MAGEEEPRAADARTGAAPLRVAVVGLSINATCGVRDHATLLTGALEREGIACTTHWLTRERVALGPSRAEIGAFTRRLSDELARERPDAILVHYSVFSFSHKGLPLFVPTVFSALRAPRVPVIVVLHEFAYPWFYGGWRGAVWAASQRVAMLEVMRAATTAVVTAEARARWLGTRRWLPRRPVLFAPVYSNLPAPDPAASSRRDGRTVGLFGYSYQGAAVSLVLDAVAQLRAGGTDVALRLLGAPGPDSPQGRRWHELAGERGIAEALSFSGALPAQELSDELAACEVLLFADAAGPSSRKTTLAAAIASGRPVVALDGPMGWRALIASGAIRVVAPTAPALAGALGELLSDEDARERTGERARAFYAREMALERTAATFVAALPAPAPER